MSEGSRTYKLGRLAGVSEAGGRCRNPERSRGPCALSEGSWTCKLRRLAGVSEAGGRCRNPERSRGTLRNIRRQLDL